MKLGTLNVRKTGKYNKPLYVKGAKYTLVNEWYITLTCGDIISKFSTKKQAIEFAKNNQLTIVK
jgi:hypothetical protein